MHGNLRSSSDPASTAAALQAVAGDKYTYRDLDDFTDTIQRSLKTLPIVSKVERSGVLNENVFLNFSQERLAQYKLKPADLPNTPRGPESAGQWSNAQRARTHHQHQHNGRVQEHRRSAECDHRHVAERNTALFARPGGYRRGYDSPPSFLNRYTRRDENGNWITTRAITLSVQMRKGEQISSFGKLVDANLESVRKSLPADLVLARTSDQPLQVHDSIELFSHSLIEALVLVVIVALIGFWSWRTAMLIAVVDADYAGDHVWCHQHPRDRPATGLDRFADHCARDCWWTYQWYRATQLCANWATGQPRSIAAWLGPTKLFKTMALCNRDEHRFVSAISAVTRRYREIPVQPAHCD